MNLHANSRNTVIMAATQTLRMDNNPIRNDEEIGSIPRIDLAKIDNVPYYIESNNSSFIFLFSKKNKKNFFYI